MLGQGADGAALRRAGRAVVTAVDEAARAGELAYHNRYHVAEAVQAMAWLCATARDQGLIDCRDAALGIVAMLGHDLGHDGDTALDGRLESKAAGLVCDIARRAGVSPWERACLAEIIRATQPDLHPENARRAIGLVPSCRQGRGLAMLRLLANEADAFASLLPGLGPKLGVALASERKARGDETAAVVASHAGRLGFLLGFRRFSPAARRLGLAATHHRQVRAHIRAGRLFGTGPDPTMATMALDALRP